MAAEATDTPTKKKRTREEKEARAARKAAKKEKADRKADKSADKVETPQIAEKSAEVKGTATVFDAFSQAPFAPAVCAALEAAYPSPTPIQAQAWPLALSGEDLIAVAKTGSGKTLAFVLPILHQLQSSGKADGAVGGLVLSPTRELALQIHVEAERYAKLVGLRTACVYGGTNVREQKAALATSRPTLIVATPGRLVDLLNQDAIKLGACSHIALDEADRLLDMGFKPQLEATYKALPAKRQTLLFTATWPKAVRKLASAYLRDEPTTLFLSGAQPAGDATSAVASNGDGSGEGRADSGADACELSANVAVSQSFQQATDDEKDNKLWTYLCELPEGSRVIVFANTKRRVDNLAKTFAEFGTCAIHGDKLQHEREAALNAFVNNGRPLMMATDVAARGLDIKLVTHVINYDMARDVESYVHRIGRTGRAGAVGTSFTFWNPDYDKDCAPALVKIARRAGQPVPDWLAKFESGKANKLWAVAKAEKEVAALAEEIGRAKQS